MIVRAVAGVDLRDVGSGNIGATNVGRAAGWTWAIIVLALDALKGAGPTWAALWLAEQWGIEASPTTAQVLTATAAILGHMFPVWLGFRGGKGVATALGAVSVLAPASTIAAAAVFSIVFGGTRIVSLGSILAAIAFAGCELWILRPNPFGGGQRALAWFSVAIPLLILVRHRGNIARLLRGTEKTYAAAKHSLQAKPSATEAPSEPAE
jgi:glycerol-3-phosphate acyltransferase PlsY